MARLRRADQSLLGDGGDEPALEVEDLGGLQVVRRKVGGKGKRQAVGVAGMADAQRGNPGAQYMQGLIMEHYDMKEAVRWYEAAAAQGYELAAQRLEALRQEAAAAR